MPSSSRKNEIGVFLGPLITGKHPDKMASNIFKLFRTLGIQGGDISKVSVNPQVGFAKVELFSRECEDYVVKVLSETRCVMSKFDLRKLTEKPQYLNVERIVPRSYDIGMNVEDSSFPSTCSNGGKNRVPTRCPGKSNFSYNPVVANSGELIATLKQKLATKHNEETLKTCSNDHTEDAKAVTRGAASSSSFRFPTPPPSLTPSQANAHPLPGCEVPSSLCSLPSLPKAQESLKTKDLKEHGLTDAKPEKASVRAEEKEETSYEVISLSQTSSTISQAGFEKLEEEETDTPTPTELLKIRQGYASFTKWTDPSVRDGDGERKTRTDHKIKRKSVSKIGKNVQDEAGKESNETSFTTHPGDADYVATSEQATQEVSVDSKAEKAFEFDTVTVSVRSDNLEQVSRQRIGSGESQDTNSASSNHESKKMPADKESESAFPTEFTSTKCKSETETHEKAEETDANTEINAGAISAKKEDAGNNNDEKGEEQSPTVHANASTSPVSATFCTGPSFYHINQNVEVSLGHVLFETAHLVTDNLREFRRMVGKYVCAYLNGNGGTMFFGVDKHGVVQGIPMTHKYEDAVRLDIDSVIRSINPVVPTSAYRVSFPRVMDETGYLLPDMRILEIHVFSRSQQKTEPKVGKRSKISNTNDGSPTYMFKDLVFAIRKDKLIIIPSA